jgi:alpha-L-fucosidase
MRKLIAASLMACASLLTTRAQAPAPKAPDPAKEKRLEWFREAKYGMFIHWGLYAIPAGEWNGRRCLGLGEWLMNRRRVGAAGAGRRHEVHGDHLEAP